MVSNLGPYGEQGALPLVVTRAVFVGLAKVSDHNWSIDSTDDRAQSDCFGRSSEHVAASDTAFGDDDARPLEGEKDLLEIWLW
jgi:hypothetical protein